MKSDSKAVELLQKIWETNKRINKYEANIVLVRSSGDMLKGIFPPMDPQYVQAKGLINYTNKPQVMQLLLYPDGRNDFYYKFTTNDGFQVTLNSGYEKLLKQIQTEKAMTGESPLPSPLQTFLPIPSPSATTDTGIQISPSVSPSASPTDSPMGLATASPGVTPEVSSPTPSPDATSFYDFPELGNLFKPESKNLDGSLVFSSGCPLNLMFPFTFKTLDPNASIKYIGTEQSQGYRCNVIEIQNPQSCTYRVYITDDKTAYIVQVDQKSPAGVVYASAYYSEFKNFVKGGWYAQNIKLIILSQSVAQAMISDIKTRNDIDITGAPKEKPKAPTVIIGSPNKDIITFPPVWQIGLIVTVLILLVILTILFYRYWFYKAKREPFAREVIVVEGDRAEEKISHTLADLGIPSTAFTSEKLTEERKLLDQQQGGKRPRVVVIAPGMFSQVKPFNFLIKAYVQDGGRVIILEHGVEQCNDMPFTPTFMPYDKNDPNLTFMVHPLWEKIWRKTSVDEIKKRTAAFNPYELIARIKEQSVDIDPIIYVTNPKTDFNAVAVALLKEGKGEYLIVQYRLIEAIKKLKFTSATAEKMLLDLMSYMFGDEKRIEIAPDWILNLLGMGGGKQEKEVKQRLKGKK
ncbi:MAG: hypothetical protein LWY06_00655 [Firmicutes bacterium]|nr:hypothetical protein [Bacillota bacterium]